MDSKQKPGFINFKADGTKSKLDDLWFITGSRCNLSCSHCYVASSPTNDLLEQLTLDDIKPFLEEAKLYGIKNVYFTGGEPFINKDIISMIESSLSYADVTVLTNATKPLSGFIKKLGQLREKSKNELKFRVSFDHFKKEKHDQIRGKGNFDITLKNTISLSKAGFTPIITVTAGVYEGNNLKQHEVEKMFKEMFLKYDAVVDVKLLPYNLEMGSNLLRIKNPTKKVFISESCMKLPGIKQENFQCHNGRSVEKINGKMAVYPCPIIFNEPESELSANLSGSFNKTYLIHKACFDFCYRSGGKCTN